MNSGVMKVAGETETKGQIKLRFKTAAGKDVVCIRSFQLTQKATKMEYKAIESVLQTINPHTGEVLLLLFASLYFFSMFLSSNFNGSVFLSEIVPADMHKKKIFTMVLLLPNCHFFFFFCMQLMDEFHSF